MSEDEGMQDQPQRYPSRRFPSAYFKAKPVKIGDELDVTISEISRRGDGLTRVDGYVIFVPNTKQGDSVKVKITQIRPNYAIGEIKT